MELFSTTGETEIVILMGGNNGLNNNWQKIIYRSNKRRKARNNDLFIFLYLVPQTEKKMLQSEFITAYNLVEVLEIKAGCSCKGS